MAAFYGCANIVPPSGGEVDKTPPVLLAMSPADSGLSTRVTRIEMHFNKFMVVTALEKNLQLSPILVTNPVVMANGRKVTVTIPDSVLTPNTTYRIGLGNALTDNRENTPYKNFVYVFSTGPYFDSLELKGKVIDAKTGKADSAIMMALYEVSESDTAVMRKKPKYATRIDASGNFKFQSLPQRAFKMYAIMDANSNYLYDYGDEKIGFLNQTVTPGLNDSSYTFYTFKEVKDTTALASITVKDTTSNKDTTAKSLSDRKDARRAFINTKTYTKLSKTNIGYKVGVDTSDITKRTFDLRLPLVIDLTTFVDKLDTPKVYLSYDNDGIEVEAVQKLKVDSGKIKINTQWLGDKVYTLRLVKGWAKDSLGDEFPPGKYKFRTKGDQDYSSMTIHLAKPYRKDSLDLYIFQEKDSIYLKKITDSVVTIKLLNPGNYFMQIILDANNNGKWDPGNLLEKIQPEKVINYPSTITLKAGWDNDIDFTDLSAVPAKKTVMGVAPPADSAKVEPIPDADKKEVPPVKK